MAQDILAITGQNEFEKLLRLSLDDFDPNLVHFSSSEKDALEKAQKFDIALIILDAESVDYATSLMQALRQFRPESKLILAPPFNEPEHPTIKELLPDALLSRPFLRDDLLDTILELTGIAPTSPIHPEPAAQPPDFNTLLDDLKLQLDSQSNVVQQSAEKTGDLSLIEELENLLAKSDEIAKRPPLRQETPPPVTPALSDDTVKIDVHAESVPVQSEKTDHEDEILSNVLRQLEAQSTDIQTFDFETFLPEDEDLQQVEIDEDLDAELENLLAQTNKTVSPEDEAKELDDLLLQLDRQSVQEMQPEPPLQPPEKINQPEPLQEDEQIPPDLMRELIESSTSQNQNWTSEIEDWETFSDNQGEPPLEQIEQPVEADALLSELEEMLAEQAEALPEQTETVIEQIEQPEEADALLSELEEMLAEEAEALPEQTETIIEQIEQPVEGDALLSELEEILAEQAEALPEQTETVIEQIEQPAEADALLSELEEMLAEQAEALPEQAETVIEQIEQPAEADALPSEREEMLAEQAEAPSEPAESLFEQAAPLPLIAEIISDPIKESFEQADFEPVEAKEEIAPAEIETISEEELSAVESVQVQEEFIPAVSEPADEELTLVVEEEPAQDTGSEAQTPPIELETVVPEPDFIPRLRQALTSGLSSLAGETLTELAGYHSVPAVLIAHRRKVWASSSQLQGQDLTEIEKILQQSGPEKEKVDMARFLRLGMENEKYLLYATTITGALTLCTINETAKPLSQIRSQTMRLANELEVDSYNISTAAVVSGIALEKTPESFAPIPVEETAQTIEPLPEEIIQEPPPAPAEEVSLQIPAEEIGEPTQTTVDALLAETAEEILIPASQAAEEWVHELPTEEPPQSEQAIDVSEPASEPVGETEKIQEQTAFEIPFEELESILPGEAEEITPPEIIEESLIDELVVEPAPQVIQLGGPQPESIAVEDKQDMQDENIPTEIIAAVEDEPQQVQEPVTAISMEAVEATPEASEEIEIPGDAEAENEFEVPTEREAAPVVEAPVQILPALAAHILPKAGYGRIKNKKSEWEKEFLTLEEEFCRQQKHQFSHKQPSGGVQLEKPGVMEQTTKNLPETDWQPTQIDSLTDIRHKLKNQKQSPIKWLDTTTDRSAVFGHKRSIKEDILAVAHDAYTQIEDGVLPAERHIIREEPIGYDLEENEYPEEDTQPVEIQESSETDVTAEYVEPIPSVETSQEEPINPPETLLGSVIEPAQMDEPSPEDYQGELDEILQNILEGLDQKEDTQPATTAIQPDEIQTEDINTLEAETGVEEIEPLEDVEVVILDDNLDFLKELAAEMDFETQYASDAEETGEITKENLPQDVIAISETPAAEINVPEIMPEITDSTSEEIEPVQIEELKSLSAPSDEVETEAGLSASDEPPQEPISGIITEPIEIQTPAPEPAEDEDAAIPPINSFADTEEIDHNDFVKQVREKLATTPEPEESITPPDIDEEFSWSVIALQQDDQPEQIQEYPEELENVLSADEIPAPSETPPAPELEEKELWTAGVPETLHDMDTPPEKMDELASEETTPSQLSDKNALPDENFEDYPVFDEWEADELPSIEDESAETELDLEQIIAEVLAERDGTEDLSAEELPAEEAVTPEAGEIPILAVVDAEDFEAVETTDWQNEEPETDQSTFQAVLSARMDGKTDEILDADLLPWENEPVAAPESIEVTPTPRALLEEEQSTEGLVDILADTSLAPVNLSFDQPLYTCILVPELSEFSLNNRIATRIKEWLPRLSRVFGWQFENVLIQPTYLQWTVRVPSGTSQGSIVRRVRQQTSMRIFEEFPDLQKLSHSGNFWAKGYLVVSGGSPPPAEFLDDFIQKNRRPKGILGS